MMDVDKNNGIMKTIPPELEFAKLLRLIADLTHSDASGNSVLGILPMRSRNDIETRQGLIREIMRLTAEGAPLRFSRFPDISPLLSRVRPEGSVLEASELASFIPALEITSEVSGHIHQREGFPLLKDLTLNLTGFPEIRRTLRKSVDSEGNILDTASALLADLRDQIRRLEVRIRKKLEEMVRDESIAVFLQDDFITKRSGRWVIPVRMDSKGQVSGVVHDVSKSGETAFVEPIAIINLANELENLVAEQKAEEIRILKSISSMIRGSADALQEEFGILVHVDMLNAVALFADRLRMEIPSINEAHHISLVQARHPLLLLALRKSGGHGVVPLDLELGRENTVMIITGSNAGGKTIAIKTVGLLLMMALSGMPIPARSSSSLPLVSDVFVDIGDEQSIENNLSTFSAHISNISEILSRADSGSLVLIDELGTGTDPEEGAALACAILAELRQRGALLLATTHLADIKGFVHKADGMVNASMDFDRKTLSPLYRLKIGEPGQSYALETAARFGLPDNIIRSAKAMMGSMKVEFDNLIEDLNRKRFQYERDLEYLSRMTGELEEKTREADSRLAAAEAHRKEILLQSHREASGVVSDVKRQMHELLRELRKKEKSERHEVVKQVEAVQKEVLEKIRDFEKDLAPPLRPEEVKEGDVVFVRSFGYDALVLKVMKKQDRVKVRAGDRDVEVPLADICFRKGRELEISTEKEKRDTGDEAVPLRLNLVGLRVDDALSRLERFLNHASMAGLREVTVIHGLGTGVLARAVREHMEGHPLVRHFRQGEQSEGGAGVTIVTIA